jgi:hypothetical protein
LFELSLRWLPFSRLGGNTEKADCKKPGNTGEEVALCEKAAICSGIYHFGEQWRLKKTAVEPLLLPCSLYACSMKNVFRCIKIQNQ